MTSTTFRMANRFVVLTAAALLLTAAPARAELYKTTPKMLAAFKEVVSKPSAGTVRVRCGGKEVALGVVVRADGFVLTKASELTGPPTVELKDGRKIEAQLAGYHERYDLALLKLDAKNLAAVEWRDSKAVEVGDWLATPGPAAVPVAVGVLSVATRKPRSGDMPPVRGTDSGYMGVYLGDGKDGVEIREVTKGGAAFKAGMKAKDVILEVGGRKVTDPDSLINLVQRFKAGESLALKVKRGKEVVELKVTLDGRPKMFAREDLQNRMGGPLSVYRGGFPVIFQHDMVLKPTECGGPVVDLDGKAVGLNIARAGRTESYAIPSEVVLGLLPDFLAGKLAPTDELVARVHPKAVPNEKAVSAKKRQEEESKK